MDASPVLVQAETGGRRVNPVLNPRYWASLIMSKLFGCHPYKFGVMNGVPIRHRYLVTPVDEHPDWEAELIHHIRTYIHPNDDVVVVGGFKGSSTVVAARRCLPDGSVTVYEAVAKHIPVLEDTLRVNRMEGHVKVVHGVVEAAVHLFGRSDPGDAEEVSSTDLPACDVLVLDCEGAEKAILENLDQQPRTIIVEVHPQYGFSLEEAKNRLTDHGYRIVEVVDGEGETWNMVAEWTETM